MDKNKLPEKYQPFNVLVVCTNTMINGFIPIEIDGNIPFLVGKGVIPTIWLSAPSERGKWIDLVAFNKRVDQKKKKFKEFLLTIEESIEEKRIDVSMWKTKILSVVQVSDDTAIVEVLDLRPFNLMIYGGTDGLRIGNQTLRNNTMENVHTMIGIGGQ